MQASALPSLAAIIAFGYYPDSGSVSAADNRVYAWHIYMLSPCFLLNFLLPYIFPFGRIFTPVFHCVYITLFRHFVYAILFKSLRLLRLHLMQVLPLPSLPAFITFGYYPDSGSVSAADNRVYAWHIYMLSPCFPVKFLTSSHFPLRTYIYARLSLCLHHFVYITLFRHFVYAILFTSLRLLRLHLMQVLPLPSLAAFITFGYYPDSGSVSAADNRVYAWHIYMLSPCFPVKICTFSHIFRTFLAFPFALFKYFL